MLTHSLVEGTIGGWVVGRGVGSQLPKAQGRGTICMHVPPPPPPPPPPSPPHTHKLVCMHCRHNEYESKCTSQDMYVHMHTYVCTCTHTTSHHQTQPVHFSTYVRMHYSGRDHLTCQCRPILYSTNSTVNHTD